MTNLKNTTVFYDGACPLCQKEISFYRRRRGAGNVIWIDVSCSEGNELAPGLSRDQVLHRFHVINIEGQIVSGGAAFACLWAALPGFERFAKLFQARPFLFVLNLLYDLFLKIRPLLQTIARVPESSLSRKIFCWNLRGLPSNHSSKPKRGQWDQ